MSGHRDPLHCVLPPFVLESIAVQGDEGQRTWAARALDRDHSIRLARVENAKVRAGGPREGADALAVEATQPKPYRAIRDAAGQEDVWGNVVREEGDKATRDKAVDEAYNGLGQTWTFFNELFERDSIDDAGMPLRGVVHFGEQYPNAFWDGRRMVFGDGDGEILGRMTRSLDVIGHELAPRSDRGRGRPGVLREVRRPERVALRCLRIACRAAQEEAEGQRGRLARSARRSGRRRSRAMPCAR